MSMLTQIRSGTAFILKQQQQHPPHSPFSCTLSSSTSPLSSRTLCSLHTPPGPRPLPLSFRRLVLQPNTKHASVTRSIFINKLPQPPIAHISRYSTAHPVNQYIMSTQASGDVFEAAAAGDLEMIKSLGRIHLEAKNDRGWTPVRLSPM